MTFAQIKLSDFQLTILNNLSEELISKSPLLGKIDGIFQINTELETCFNRIRNRARIGESAISMEYLKQLEGIHNKWKNNNFSPYTPDFIQNISNDDGNLDCAISNVVSGRYQYCEINSRRCRFILSLLEKMNATSGDRALLEKLFLNAVFPSIYKISKSLLPLPCGECRLFFPLHPSHSCQKSEEDKRFHALTLAAIQQARPFDILWEVNDILKKDQLGIYEDVTLREFLSFFVGESGDPNILTQLVLNDEWIETISVKAIALDREGLEANTWDMSYLPASSNEDGGEEINTDDSSKGVFGD